jgi:putative hemolysin
MSPLWVAAAASLVALAFFTAFKAALTSLSRFRLRHWVGKQISGSSAEDLLARPQELLTTAFVGSNLSRICLGVSATLLVVGHLAFARRSPLLAALAAVAIVTPPALLIGEVLPRAVVRAQPGRLLAALLLAGRFFGLVFWPFVVLMNGSAALLFRLLRIPPPARERSFNRDSIDVLLREGEREGLVEPHEREIIGGIFSFNEKPVRDVMTPREKVTMVRLGSSREALARVIWETGFSRFPVIDGSPDNIVGSVHAVDVLKARDGERLRLRPTLFVPETMNGAELLYAMRRQRIQLAVVIDEHGATAGVVTMEDLVEELVGEIADEHDVEAVEETPVQRVQVSRG